MKNITKERLREVLAYDAGTGDFTWTSPPWNHPRMLGQTAGCGTTGYTLIRIDGQKYKAHRLAWLYAYDEWPSHDIDHKDGNPFNNALSNLREATISQNLANMKRRKNKKLPKGVRANGKRYTARISYQKKLITLGTYATVDEAAASYAQASRQYYGEFGRPA